MNDKCFIQDMQNLKRIGTVDMVEGLYRLKMLPLKEYAPSSITAFVSATFVPAVSTSVSSFSCNKIAIDLWHFRLGHPSSERMLLLKQCYPLLTTDKQFVCHTCHHSKQKKQSFPSSISHSSCVFALIHADIWGPCSVTSLNGYKYFLTIVDDHSRFVWIFLMHSKAETQTHLKKFVAMVERQFDTKVKMIRSDNGSEFILRQFYDETEIIH